MVSSFFFTNNTGAPYGDTFDQIKPLSTKSLSWVFNSFNSVVAILYGGIEIGVELDNSSILNSNSLSGGKHGKFSGNTFENSHITATLSKVTYGVDLSTTCAK